jgi:hypothetical protein
MNYLVVNIEDANEFYLVNDVNELINEMYECQELYDNDFETVKGWFLEVYKVFFSNSDIEEAAN